MIKLMIICFDIVGVLQMGIKCVINSLLVVLMLVLVMIMHRTGVQIRRCTVDKAGAQAEKQHQ